MSVFTDDSRKKLRFFYESGVEFTEHYVVDTFSCEDILTSDQLNFGEAASARVQFHTDIDLELTGQKFYVTYGTDNEYVKIGTYKATYTSRKVNSTICNITAYDAVKDFDVNAAEWYNSLNFPITVAQLRESLCNYIGIIQENRTLINDSVVLQKTVFPTAISARDILGYIGQVNACFPHATSEYTLDWVSLGTAAKPVDPSYLIGAKSYEAKSYRTAQIGGVTVRREDGDAGVSVGSGTNHFIISANILLYGMDPVDLRPIAERIYNKIKDCRYVPSEVTIKYIPDFSIGSLLSYDGNLFYNLGQKLSGCLSATITADGNMYLEETGLETSVQQLLGKSNVMTRTIEENTSAISEFDRTYVKESVFSQTVDGINSQLSSIEQEIDGSIQVYNTTYEPTLLNYPAWDFSFTIPCNDTVRCSDELKLEYLPEYYQKFQRSVVYDENSLQTYKFARDQETGAFYWRPETDSEFGVALEKISQLSQTVDGVSSSVSAVSRTVTLQGVKITDNSSKISETAEAISTEVRRATDAEEELSTQMQQTAKSIALSVSDQKGSATISISITDAKTGKPTTVSKQIDLDADTINLSASDIINMIAGGTINLTAGRIAITSDNFSVDKNGHVVMKSAEITGYATEDGLENGTLHVNGNCVVDGTIDGEKVTVINVKAKSVDAEDITGETFSGKKIKACEIEADTRGIIGGWNIGSDALNTSVNKRVQWVGGSTPRDVNFAYGMYSVPQISYGSNLAIASIIEAVAQNYSSFKIGLTQYGLGIISERVDHYVNNTFFRGNVAVNGKVSADSFGDVISTGKVYANGHDLDISDGQVVIACPERGKLRFAQIGDSTIYQVTGTVLSDTRLKENITDSEVDALSVIEQIRPIQFDWKADGTHVDLGFSANQLEEVVPQAVHEVEQPEENEFDSLKQIDTSALTIYLVKAIQELSAKNKRLEQQILDLEGKING